MNRSVRNIVNFFAFNLLFFSLYLNFIHKDQTDTPEKTAILANDTNANTALITKKESDKDEKTKELILKTKH